VFVSPSFAGSPIFFVFGSAADRVWRPHRGLRRCGKGRKRRKGRKRCGRDLSCGLPCLFGAGGGPKTAAEKSRQATENRRGGAGATEILRGRTVP